MASQAQIDANRRNAQKSRNEHQNDEIEPDSDVETLLAASLATRETAPDPQPLEITKSNPIAIAEEATNEDDNSENHEIKPNRCADDQDATADPSPGIAIPRRCAAVST